MTNLHRVFIGLGCLYVVGIIFSPVVLSISMFLLAVFGVFKFWDESGRVSFGVNPILIQRLKSWKQYLPHLSMALLFFLIFINVWMNPGTDYFWDRIRIKIPFLVLPIVFLGYPALKKNQLTWFFTFFLLFMTTIGVGVLVNYVMDFQRIQDDIGLGHPMPTPRNHIRFSMMVAISILGGLFLLIENKSWPKTWMPKLTLRMTIFLFVFIHILSVRTGIVCLYSGLMAIALHRLSTQGKRRWAILSLLGLVLLPVVAVKSVPSLNQKVSYMVYDLQKFMEGEGDAYSDSGRLISWQMALDLFKEKPILGVGAGNLREEMHQAYASKYPDALPRMPHNQWLYVLAGMGMIGVMGFIWIIFYPFFKTKAYGSPLYLGIFAFFMAGFMLEHTLENAVGIAMYSFFSLLALHRWSVELKN